MRPREQLPPEGDGAVRRTRQGMIPLPGASFVYSLLKDAAKAGLPWFRGRRFQLWAKGWTVGRWYHPYDAAEKFGDQDYFQYWKEAQQEKDKAYFAWCKSYR